MNYSDVKEAQEKSIIDDFINWMNEDGNEFVVLARCDSQRRI